MNYGITRLALGKSPFIELERTEFEAITKAKEQLIGVLEIEQKLDLLLSNYLEYEQTLLEITLERMIHFSATWSDFRKDNLLINRRLANLLSSARSYVDQMKRAVNRLYGRHSRQAAMLDSSFAQASLNSFAYRFLKGLRDYAQHAQLPVKTIKYPHTLEHDRSDTPIRCRIVPLLLPDTLQDGWDRRNPDLKEAANLGKEIPLTPLVREYVSTMGQIHEDLREQMEKDVLGWRSIYCAVLDRARAPFEGKLTGLGVVAQEKPGIWEESHQIFEDLSKESEYLARKNRFLGNLSRLYVSGDHRGRDV